MRNSLFFRLPCPPLAKRGSLTHSQALALSKRARDVTAPPVALNRCAIRLAGHQSPRQVVMRDGTALLNLLLVDCYYILGIRALARVVLAGMNPHGENLLKQE